MGNPELKDLSKSELETYNSLVRLGDSNQLALDTVLHIKQNKPIEIFWETKKGVKKSVIECIYCGGLKQPCYNDIECRYCADCEDIANKCNPIGHSIV